MELEDFFYQLRDAVRFYPVQDLKCLQPQTFRVLSFDAELTYQNGMGATVCDAEKSYFFSRQWEADRRNPNKISAPYPVVTAFVTGGSLKDPFQKTGTRTAGVTLAVWDHYDQDKCAAGRCSGCEGRTVNEIFRDTAGILRNVLFYLGDVVEATTNLDSTLRFYHLDLLKQAVTAGDITSFQIRSMWRNTLAPQNSSIAFTPAERVADMLFGTFCTVNLTVPDCAEAEWAFDVPNNGVLGHEAGCRDCS